MGLWKLVWILFVMISQRPWFVCGAISVRFKIGSHLHVALGQTLLLEAEFGRNQEDQIDLVTWERARDSENVRISPSTRISLERDDSLLRIKFVRPKDFGTYKVTVTDSNGQQEHASIQVRQIDKPPKASMANVLECVVEDIGVIQWDSPRFTWVVDDVVVTNQMALLGNGSKLNISEVQGNNYTCVISSSLGVSTTHYQAPQMPASPSCHCAFGGLIVVGLFFVIVLCVVGAIAIRKKRNRVRVESVPVPTDPNNQ